MHFKSDILFSTYGPFETKILITPLDMTNSRHGNREHTLYNADNLTLLNLLLITIIGVKGQTNMSKSLCKGTKNFPWFTDSTFNSNCRLSNWYPFINLKLDSTFISRPGVDVKYWRRAAEPRVPDLHFKLRSTYSVASHSIRVKFKISQLALGRERESRSFKKSRNRNGNIVHLAAIHIFVNNDVRRHRNGGSKYKQMFACFWTACKYYIYFFHVMTAEYSRICFWNQTSHF